MGTRWNRLTEAVLTSTTIYVLSRNMKNIRVFLSENFQFLEVKFSIYLNRLVFVMQPFMKLHGITKTHIFKYIENFTSTN